MTLVALYHALLAGSVHAVLCVATRLVAYCAKHYLDIVEKTFSDVNIWRKEMIGAKQAARFLWELLPRGITE